MNAPQPIRVPSLIIEDEDVLHDGYGPGYSPDSDDIEAYCRFLGADPSHAESAALARQALKMPMPAGWTVCRDVHSNKITYRNDGTGEKSRVHPCDRVCIEFRAGWAHVVMYRPAHLVFRPNHRLH